MEKTLKEIAVLMLGIIATGVALSYMQTGALGGFVQGVAKRTADGFADYNGAS
jgi:hypothetical protein